MAVENIHDLHFQQATESRQQLDVIRSKLIEGMLELSEAKRLFNSNQKELVEKEVRLDKLVKTNEELKISLMKALIEKEELQSKKGALLNNITDLNQQIENLERDSNLKLCSDRVKSFCERSSTAKQTDLLNKIVDAKCQLMKFGFPSYSSDGN